MQTELQAIKSRMNNAEVQSSDMENRIMEISQSGQQTENQIKKKKHESNIRDLWDNIKWVNLCIIRIQENERGTENVFEEIMSENFPNLKERDIKTGSTEGMSKVGRCTLRHIIKMAKLKIRILKAEREKQRLNYKGTFIRLSADFATETPQAGRERQDIFKVLKGKICNLKYSIHQEYHLK